MAKVITDRGPNDCKSDRARVRPAILAVFVIALAIAVPTYASFVINATFDSSITGDSNAAAIESSINSAISFYESTLTDPIAVSIQFGEMTSGLGQSTSGFHNVLYSTYLAALLADKASSDDATALSLLPTNATNNPVNGNTTINVKSANLRAVGLAGAPGVAGCGGACDGVIGLNTHITDIGSPGTSGQFSLFATVEHEIDEVLGLGSSLPSTPFTTIFPEDLFRYDATGHRSFTKNSAQAFFSIDATTDLAQFDNQNDGGDFGDWQSNPLPSGVGPKVQDAFASPGAHLTLGISSPEVVALDVIGYDVAIPEPTTMVLLGAGLVAIGILRRPFKTS